MPLVRVHRLDQGLRRLNTPVEKLPAAKTGTAKMVVNMHLSNDLAVEADGVPAVAVGRDQIFELLPLTGGR